MKEKIKKVYYCDFCGKHRLTSNSMLLHEKHCTLNPNRVCRVCGGEDEECPMCIFSKRRLKIKNDEKEFLLTDSNFDLKEKLREYWNKKEEVDY